MNSFYMTLCKLGPRLIDDSKRFRDAYDRDNNALSLRSDVSAQGMFCTVRQLIRYGTQTDGMFTEGIEYALAEGFKKNDPIRKVAYAAAEAWLGQACEFLYSEIHGGCNTQGWRLNKSDRKAMNILVEAARAEKEALGNKAEESNELPSVADTSLSSH